MANLKNGLYTAKAIAQRQEVAARLSAIEDVMHLTGMTNAPRTRGRKPMRHQSIVSSEDFLRMFGIGCNRSDDDSR